MTIAEHKRLALRKSNGYAVRVGYLNAIDEIIKLQQVIDKIIHIKERGGDFGCAIAELDKP